MSLDAFDVRVERPAGLTVMLEAFLKVRSVGLRFHQRQQSLDHLLHVADESEVEAAAPTEVLGADVHLGYLRPFGVPVVVGKVCA